jgi:predicted PurR-regulated permease PerM
MAILNPLVTKLTTWRIPRGLSVVLCYVLILGGIGFLISLIIPPLVEQSTNFVTNLPRFISNVGLNKVVSDQIINQGISQLGSLPSGVLKFGVSVFSNFINVLAVLFLAFYLLVSRNKLDSQISFLFGEEKRTQIEKVVNLWEKRLGSWARGQFILMVIIGVVTYIGLLLLGIPYALPLAILAGILEIVPTLGPIVASIPSILIGLSISPLMGLAAASLAFLINQTENYVLVPKVMEKSVGVSPIIILLTLAVGLRIAGVIGVLISVPVLLTVKILFDEYLLARSSK